MQTSRPLLSICIPTFNRCQLIETTLASLVGDPSFDQRLEVIVSDNCSTDGTRTVVETFSALHPEIKYYCNTQNIREGNFELALTRASGVYAKLHNDYLQFLPGKLEAMLDRLSKRSRSDGLLLFLETGPLGRRGEVGFDSMDSFLQSSFHAFSWIANVGVWGGQLGELNDKLRFVNRNYPHLDWVLRIGQKSLPINVVFDSFYDHSRVPTSKATYNVFEVNVENLLRVVNRFNWESRALSPMTMLRMKHHLFRHVVMSFYLTMLLRAFRLIEKPSFAYDRWVWISIRHFGVFLVPFFVDSAVRLLASRGFQFRNRGSGSRSTEVAQ